MWLLPYIFVKKILFVQRGKWFEIIKKLMNPITISLLLEIVLCCKIQVSLFL